MNLHEAIFVVRKEMADTNLIMLDVSKNKMIPVQPFNRAINMANAYNKLSELHAIL